jgi:hypothetical protein
VETEERRGEEERVELGGVKTEE